MTLKCIAGIEKPDRGTITLDGRVLFDSEKHINLTPQQRRVALARILASEPQAILLDEPFSALDYQTRLAVSGDIWRIIRSEGKTALLVTHNRDEAYRLCKEMIVLKHVSDLRRISKDRLTI